MKIFFVGLFAAVLTLTACNNDSSNKNNGGEEEDTVSLDLTVVNGDTTSGTGANASASQPLDCVDPGFMSLNKIISKAQKVAFGIMTTVSCGGCTLRVVCEPGANVSVTTEIWDVDQSTAGGTVGMNSGVCGNDGIISFSESYSGTAPFVRTTVTSGDESDVEYLNCLGPQ